MPLPTACAISGLSAKALRDLAIRAELIRWAVDDRGLMLVAMGDVAGLLRRGAA
ncbi:MAG: hypothetical protein R3B72_01330 [Polyangiaceae bacterium]